MYVLYEELIFIISVFKVHDTPLCFLPFFFLKGDSILLLPVCFCVQKDENILLEEHIISIRVYPSKVKGGCCREEGRGGRGLEDGGGQKR